MRIVELFYSSKWYIRVYSHKSKMNIPFSDIYNMDCSQVINLYKRDW